MKTISFELSKKLNEAWVLDNIETEYFYYLNPNGDFAIAETKTDNFREWDIKTLTLEEAIEFFLSKWPSNLNLLFTSFSNNLTIIIICDFNSDKKEMKTIHDIIWTKVEAIEKMIKYLLDNNLLNK